MTHMVGSYAPKLDLYSTLTPMEDAPSGMMKRGTYSVGSVFTDDDKTEHLKWEWSIEIKKDWDWIYLGPKNYLYPLTHPNIGIVILIYTVYNFPTLPSRLLWSCKRFLGIDSSLWFYAKNNNFDILILFY